MRRAVVGLMSAAAALAANGCIGGMCTLIGAYPGLNLQVDIAGGGSLPLGDYEVTVRADGKTFVAHPTIDAPSSSLCADCDLEADSGGRRLYVDLSITGRGGYLNVGYWEDGGPETIEVEIKQGSTVYLTRTFTPDYRPEEINGRGCGVTHQARETVTLAP